MTDCNEILHNVQLRNVEAYQQLMRESFAKAFLDDRKKIEKIINALHKE